MAGLQVDQVRLLPRVQFGFTPAQAALRLSDLHPLAGAGTEVVHRVSNLATARWSKPSATRSAIDAAGGRSARRLRPAARPRGQGHGAGRGQDVGKWCLCIHRRR